jgi:hypothetical protein
MSAAAAATAIRLTGLANLTAVVPVAAVSSIVFGLLMQVWITSVQIRRFLHWFGGQPDGNAKLRQLFDVYGWRARLAVKLFRIQLPPGFLDELKSSRQQTYPLPSGVESLVVMLIMVALLLAVGGFTYLVTR